MLTIRSFVSAAVCAVVIATSSYGWAAPGDLDTTVTVQLINDLGVCWDADYTAPATRNTEQEFKDRSD